MKNVVESLRFIENNIYLEIIQYEKKIQKSYCLNKSFFNNIILKSLKENKSLEEKFFPIEITEKSFSIITYKYIEPHFSEMFYTKYKRKLIYYFINEDLFFSSLKKYTEIENNYLNSSFEEIFEPMSISEYEISEKNYIQEYIDIEDTLNSENPIIIKGISAIIQHGLDKKASDIHIEALKDSIRIRYRIDGILLEYRKVSLSLLQGFISRLKIMSNLDITERRLPQDGSFRLKDNSKEMDFRISFIPTIHGEKAVIRILNSASINISINNLGLDNVNYQKLLKEIKKTKGIILITGPTGSGKSSTLYAIIKEINNGNINICTIEDPVENHIVGINQVQCHYEIGRDFQTMLRAFLRQDPDILMIGEIRDFPTAEIAIKAAMTGHLVFSTLHTNDAISCISRLKNIGIDPYLISATVNLVISQRLVRKLCDNCKIIDKDYEAKLLILGIKKKYNHDLFYTGNGCKHCEYTGYYGRIVIFELFFINDFFKEVISQGKNDSTIKKIAHANKMTFLLDDAMAKVISGITSLDEIIRQY
ncbi:GspE/PulE family protein [Fusobacterium sp. PH5-44]|uniref:GspE/PulE family protein n=1 Tax=unclassified Fusobacterium TaxID=2648384 RepID=UPI003D262DEA